MREAVEKKVLSEKDRPDSAGAVRRPSDLPLRKAVPRKPPRVVVGLQVASQHGHGVVIRRRRQHFFQQHGLAGAGRADQVDAQNSFVTGGTCHLDARMVHRHLNPMGFRGPGILLIENVGNLVCSSSCDLGEAAKIVLLSVTEGEDKPLNYPGIFHRSTLMILTKTDLLPHLEFNAELALANARKIHPEIDTIALSARNREGLDLWLAWLGALQQKVQHQTAAAIT